MTISVYIRYPCRKREGGDAILSNYVSPSRDARRLRRALASPSRGRAAARPLLDCAAIQAEVLANNAKVQELASESGGKVAQNVAAGVAGVFIWPLWFAMDFQGATDKEAAALNSRQQYLAVLAEQRQCGAPQTRRPLSPAAPANPPYGR